MNGIDKPLYDIKYEIVISLCKDKMVFDKNQRRTFNAYVKRVKELKEEVAEANVDYESLEEKYDNRVSALNTEIRNLKPFKKQIEEQEKIIDKLPTEIKKLFYKNKPSSFL